MNESTTINLSIPKALLQRADAQAKKEYTSRSDVFRRAILELLKREEIAEEERWQTVFHDEKGVPIDDFLRVLRENE